MVNKVIPNELASRFHTLEGRREIINKYADSQSMYVGLNALNELVSLTVGKDGMILTTYQEDGWVRVNYYDSNGYNDGETYDGRWE